MKVIELNIISMLRKEMPKQFSEGLGDGYLTRCDMGVLGLDSLHVVEVIMLVEDHYRLDLPESCLNVTTVTALAELVSQTLDRKKAATERLKCTKAEPSPDDKSEKPKPKKSKSRRRRRNGKKTNRPGRAKGDQVVPKAGSKRARS